MDVNHTKLNKQSHLNEIKIDFRSITYTTENSHGDRIKWSVFKKSDQVWSEEEINIDIGLDKFGSGLEDLKTVTIFTDRIFRCWIEDW